ncbi:MAG: transglutaminase domain-containing protein [Fimbriimonas sp.]
MAKVLDSTGALFNRIVHRDMSNLGLLDYILMGFGGSLAVWSAGMAIGSERVGLFSAGLVVAGTLFSYFVRVLSRGSKFLIADGVLYSIAGGASAIFTSKLMLLMPQQGFPPELFGAGWLSWMMIFGSFVSWRDSTLLFQAVPAIALFGLVGCYDTYRAVIFPFYGFLVCLATFFARAHGRQMLEESVSSGYFSRAQAPGAAPIRPETTPGLAAKLREGPWRWAAGPEWALASALVVVVISLLGAPVIQFSVQGVAGFVRLAVPTIRQSSSLPPMVTSAGTSAIVGIGRGAAKLTDKPVLDYQSDRLRPLRAAYYDVYNGRGWARRLRSNADPEQSTEADAIRQIQFPQEFQWRIRLQQSLRALPLPGTFISATTPLVSQPDGTVVGPSPLRGWFEITGQSIEPPYPIEATSAYKEFLPESGDFLGMVNVDPRVSTLARRVATGAANDWEKAERIKREIESRIKYNINSPAVPAGEDPVGYTLFDTHEAYCDIFASSMVLMARSVGIPARYATGFLPDANNRLGDGSVLVLEKNAHAWAELFFEGAGWVPFDATEGAEEVPGGGVGDSTDDRPWYQREWFTYLLDGLALVLTLGAGIYTIRLLRRRGQHQNLRSDLDRVYLTFAKALHKTTGIRRGMGVTADEYLAAVSPAVGSLAGEVREASDHFVKAYYAPGTLEQSVIDDMKKRVADLKTKLNQLPRPPAR